MVKNQDLWFTTSTSVSMMGGGMPSFEGLYRCSLHHATGTCHSPQEIATGWYRDGRFHLTMPMMNVQLDDTKTNIYARTFDAKRDGWEIIRTEVVKLDFKSYFRTYLKFEWNECNWDCCENEGGSYVQVAPKVFLVDGNDVFVAWDGFYKDCRTETTKKGGLLWTIGISKLKTDDSQCVLSSGDERVNFATCSEPVSIVYQDPKGRTRVVPYGGFTMVKSPGAGRRMFFMTIVHSDGFGAGQVTSEVWVAPEDADYATSPGDLQIVGALPILADYFEDHIRDVGSIRIHKDSGGRPDHLCRTVFNAAISCFPFQMSEIGRLTITEPDQQYVSKSQIEETCHIQVHRSEPYLNRRFTVTTGLEVLWDSKGYPDKIIFGCIGDIGANGNFATVDRNGNIVQTLNGAYPGSILFGTNLPQLTRPKDASKSKVLSYGVWGFSILILVVVAMVLYRKVYSRLVVRVMDHRYYNVVGSEDSPENAESRGGTFFLKASQVQIDNHPRTRYVELSSVEPNENADHVIDA